MYNILIVGSDLAVCITDALLQPIRELEHATCWKTQSSNMGSVFYTPGKEEDEGLRHCTLIDLPPHQVYIYGLLYIVRAGYWL